MNQPAIPVLNPDSFVEQFVTPDAHEQARYVHSSSGSHLSATHFFTLMRIEDFARHIAFPMPTVAVFMTILCS